MRNASRPLSPSRLSAASGLRSEMHCGASLSSLQGAAVTTIQIEGVLHEFSSLPGVLEDVTDIVLNVKSVGLRMHGDGPKRMRLRATGPGEVLAGQIETGHDIEVLNPEQVICTLDNGVHIAMELTVENGKGYVPALQNHPEDAQIGLIPVDALFSPVRKVSYRSRIRASASDRLRQSVDAGRDQRRDDPRGCGGARGAHPAGSAAAVYQFRGASPRGRKGDRRASR